MQLGFISTLTHSLFTVVTFLEQPTNVLAVIMGQAYFPCRYTEQLKYHNGMLLITMVKQVSILAQPFHHFISSMDSNWSAHH